MKDRRERESYKCARDCKHINLNSSCQAINFFDRTL